MLTRVKYHDNVIFEDSNVGITNIGFSVVNKNTALSLNGSIIERIQNNVLFEKDRNNLTFSEIMDMVCESSNDEYKNVCLVMTDTIGILHMIRIVKGEIKN